MRCLEIFSEDISWLNVASKVAGKNDPVLESITYKVVVNFDMFRPFVENRIGSKQCEWQFDCHSKEE